MKWFKQAVLLVGLSAFLGLQAAESGHIHATAKTESSCQLCNLTQATPGITQGRPVLDPGLLVRALVVSTVVSPTHTFVAAATGRSPPTL